MLNANSRTITSASWLCGFSTPSISGTNTNPSTNSKRTVTGRDKKRYPQRPTWAAAESKNDHRRHPGDQTHDGGTGAETFRVQEDRAVHDDLAGQEIEEEKPGKLDPSGNGDLVAA